MVRHRTAQGEQSPQVSSSAAVRRRVWLRGSLATLLARP